MFHVLFVRVIREKKKRVKRALRKIVLKDMLWYRGDIPAEEGNQHNRMLHVYPQMCDKNSQECLRNILL